MGQITPYLRRAFRLSIQVLTLDSEVTVAICAAALAAPNKTTLMFGDLPPLKSATALLQLSEQYYYGVSASQRTPRDSPERYSGQNSTDAPLTQSDSAPIDIMLCHYTNTTKKVQITRLSDCPSQYLERVVFPGACLLFEAPPEAHLEIHTATTISAIVADKIPCQSLSL